MFLSLQKAFDVFVELFSGSAGFDAGAWTSALGDVYTKLAAKM